MCCQGSCAAWATLRPCLLELPTSYTAHWCLRADEGRSWQQQEQQQRYGGSGRHEEQRSAAAAEGGGGGSDDEQDAGPASTHQGALVRSELLN